MFNLSDRNNKIDLSIYLNYFKNFKAKLDALSEEDRKKFIILMEDFWRFIISIRREEIIIEMWQNQEFFKYKSYFMNKWHIYISLIELEIAEHFLNDMYKVIAQTPSALSEEDYIGVDRELTLIDQDLSNYTVVMVGSGPFPETLIEVYKYQPRIKVAIGVERRKEVSELSNRVIAKFFPKTKKIKTVVSNAELFDYRGVDVIFLANGLIGKSAILRWIYQTASSEVRIIVRNPILMGTMLYEDILTLPSIKLFKIIKSVQASKLSKTFLLEKINE